MLKDAVDEVCQYVPEGQGTDFLKRAIQKFFARTMGERDFHAYEAVQLGLQLPLVIPMMPIVSLNTTGTRPLKRREHLLGADKEDEPVHYYSRADKFDQRLQLVRAQWEKGDRSVTPEEVRHVSLYEFWWKYFVKRGRVRRCQRPVCLMVTPCFGADCANVEHASHEGYARAMVIAHWRHMTTERRRAMIRQQTEVRAVPDVCIGGNLFEETFVQAGPGAADVPEAEPAVGRQPPRETEAATHDRSHFCHVGSTPWLTRQLLKQHP